MTTERTIILTREEVLRVLRSQEVPLRRRFGVRSLALFGSLARGKATSESDVDLLVEFDRPISLFDLVAVKQHLEQLLGVKKVDVTLADSVYAALSEDIFGQAIQIYGEKMEIPR